LSIKNTREIPPKKKNTGKGEPTYSITIGVNITLTDTPNQFIKVAGGTIFGGMISGT